jgi:hypothetical protein
MAAPDFFSMFSGIGDTIAANRDRNQITELGDQLAKGNVDYRDLGARALRAGNIPLGLQFIKQAEQLDSSRRINALISGISGASGADPYAAAPEPPPSINAPQRGGAGPAAGNGGFASLADIAANYRPQQQPVQPSSRWWGDAEGEAAGIYEPGARTGQTGEMSLANLAQMAGMPRPRPAEAPPRSDAIPSMTRADQFGSQEPTRQIFAQAPVAPGATGTPQPFPAQPQQQPQQQPPRPPATAQNPATRHIPAMIAAMTDPNIAPGQRDALKALLEHALKTSDLPELQKNYALYRSQGGTLPIFEYEKQLKQAGALAITNNMRGENAETAEMGKLAAARAGETMKAMGAAPKALMRLAQVDTMLGQIEQGKVQPARQSISAWAKSFGLDDATAERLGLDPKGVGTAQALSALTNELVIGKIGSGQFPANNFSDADRNFLVSTVPQLANDPRGNKIMVETARRLAHFDAAKGREWLNFRRDPANKGKNSFDDFEAAWATKIADADIFGDLRKAAQELVGDARAAGGAPLQPNTGDLRGPAQRSAAPPPPRPGTIEQGFRFKGGDPSKPESWERAQ